MEWNGMELNGIEWNRMEQNRIEQNRIEQNRIEQNRIEQNRIEFGTKVLYIIQTYMYNLINEESIYISYESVSQLFHVFSVKTVGPKTFIFGILHTFQSVNPPHKQWPAPMGSWRVPGFFLRSISHQLEFLPIICMYMCCFQSNICNKLALHNLHSLYY